MFTRKTRIIFQWEFIQKIKSRAFLFSIFFIPLVIIGFMLLPMYFVQNEENRAVTLAVDDDTGFLFPLLQAKLNDPNKFQWTSISDDIGMDLLKKGMVDGLIKLDDRVLTDRKMTAILKDGFSGSKEADLEKAVNQIFLELRLKGKGMNAQDIDLITRPITIEKESVRSKDSEFGAKYLAGVILVMLLYFSISNSAGSFLRGLSEEKNSRVMEVLIASASPRELLTGKILGLACVGLIQIAVWLCVSILLGRFAAVSILSPQIVILFVGYFVLGYFFFAGLYGLLGSAFATEQEIQPIQTVISLLGIMPIALAFKVIQSPDSLLVHVLSFVPFVTPTLMILRLVTGEVAWWEIVLTMLSQLLWIWALLWSAGKVFQVTVLMFGKKFSFKEVVACLRG